jgi:sugar lactone lactonase YvrE
LGSPDSIAVSATGVVYVTDRIEDRVRRYDAAGNHQLSFPLFGIVPGQSDPRGVAVNSSGQVYVADRGPDLVQRFDADGVHQLTFGDFGTGPGEFDDPRGVAVNSNGLVYVVDSLNNRVQRFDANGNHQLSFGTPGVGSGQFDLPTGIAVSDTDRVYVIETNNRRVQRFDADGNHQLTVGSSGFGPGQFLSPSGVAVSDTGLVYVADTGNNRVQRWFAPSEWIEPHTHTFGAVTIGETLSLSPGKILHVSGTTTVSGTGGLTLAGGQFTTGALDVQAGGSITVESGQALVASTLTHAGQINLSGTLAVVGGGLNLEDNATLLGHGAVVGRVSSTSFGIGIIVSEGETLTLGDANHADGVAIDGTIIVGAMGGPASALILLDANRATIGVTRLHGGALLDAPRGITLLAGRTLNALGNALVDGDFTNNSTVNGPAGAGQVLSFNDNVDGAGNYTGNIAFLQGFSPGASPAAVSLENLSFNPLSKLTIELGGTTAGSQFDQLVIAGDVELGSATLDVLPLNGFLPTAGQSFEILDIAGTRSGIFAGLEEGSRASNFGGIDLFITYAGGDGNDVALIAATATLAGDFNHDGIVDAADYAVWRDGLGTQYTQTEYNDWRANFGRVASGASTSNSNELPQIAVPESPTIILLMFGATAFLVCRYSIQRAQSHILSLALVTSALIPLAVRADLVQSSDPPASDSSALRLVPGETFSSTAASEFAGALTNNGTVHGPAVDDVFLTFTDHVNGAGGYTGNITFDGQFSPGNSPAVVTFEGDVNFGPSSTLNIELAGTAIGDFDRLEVSGMGSDVSLDGMLTVELINGFTLPPGDIFEIIDVGGVLSGQFDGLAEGSLVAVMGNVSGVPVVITYMHGAGMNNVALVAVPEPARVAGLGIIAASLCGWLASASKRKTGKALLPDSELKVATLKA